MTNKFFHPSLIILVGLCLFSACTKELIYNPDGQSSQSGNTMNGSDSVSIQLAEAGSLETHLKEVEKIDPLKINALKVKGDINGSDLKLIREMAGSGLKKDDKTEGQLVRLDLSEASFKQGGDAFFVYESSDGDELCLLTVDNSLPRYAFGYTRLRQLQLPEGITRVSSQAFYHCDSLRSVNIPSTVQEIGRSAFCYCHYLKSPLSIPEGIEALDDYTFYDCYFLPSISLPKSLKYIGYECFANCQSMTSLGNGSLSIDTLDEYAFYKCASLKQMVVPTSGVLPEGAYHTCTSLNNPNLSGIREIGKYAFENAILNTPILAEGIETIGDSAFHKAIITGNVVLPKSLKYVGSGAFADNDITSVTLQSDARTNHSGRSAFATNKKLTSLTVAEGVKVLDVEFGNCPALTKVSLPSTLDSIGISYVYYDAKGNPYVASEGAVFYNCKGLTNISLPEGLRYIGSSTFHGCTGLSQISLPNGISWMGAYIFSGCTGLSSIKLSTSITVVPQGMFENCTSLKQITLPSATIEVDYQAFKGSGLTSIQLPDGVQEIGPMAFENCASLTSVNLPSALQKIEHDAFSGCTALTSVSVSAECQLNTIGASAFNKCSALRSFSVPSSVSNIGQNAFSTCGLEQLELPASLAEIGDGAFSHCGRLKSVTNQAVTPQDIATTVFVGVQLPEAILQVPATAVEAYKQNSVWGRFGTITALP